MRRHRAHDALTEMGFVLVAINKHRKYRHPSGVITVCSNTPSDHRSADNEIARARRLLRQVACG
jgi:hypothetical protein